MLTFLRNAEQNRKLSDSALRDTSQHVRVTESKLEDATLTIFNNNSHLHSLKPMPFTVIVSKNLWHRPLGRTQYYYSAKCVQY